MEKSSLDVSTAPDASGSALASGAARKRIANESSDDDDELGTMLQDELERADLGPQKGKAKAKATEAPRITPGDCVARYHEMIRRALVDWGDEILDKVAARFAGDAKIVHQIDDVRKESIDPLRTWSALPM